MNLFKNTGLGFIFLLMCGNAIAQNDFCSTRNTSFQDGEDLVFRAYYNMGLMGLTAGTAELSITSGEVNGHKAYHIIADGKTSKSYEWFYKVRDRYETYIDKETMMPLHFIRNVNEGGFKINNDVYFNHAKEQAISTGKTFKIPKCTQDVLSAIYYARNIDYNKYKPGDKIPFNMFLDDKVYALYIRYIGKEKITTKLGTFNAIKISPLLIEGTIFKGGEKMTVWVSDDENHIPIRVESPILVGSVRVDLVSYNKLRSSFSGLVKGK